MSRSPSRIRSADLAGSAPEIHPQAQSTQSRKPLRFRLVVAMNSRAEMNSDGTWGRASKHSTPDKPRRLKNARPDAFGPTRPILPQSVRFRDHECCLG